MSGKKTKIIIACVTVVAIGAVSLGAAGIGEGGGDNASPEAVTDERITVDVMRPVPQDIAVTNEFIGTLDANRQVTVFPKAAGEILLMNYDKGDYVEEGAVLAVIDSTALELSIAQTRAAVGTAQQRANYSLAMAQNALDVFEFKQEGGYNAGLNGAATAVEQAEIAVKNAESGVELANNQLNSALANRRSARRGLDNIRDGEQWGYEMQMTQDAAEHGARDGIRQADISVDNAYIAVENAERALDAAKVNLQAAKDSERIAKVGVSEQRNLTNQQIEMARINANLSDQYISITRMENDLKNYAVTANISGYIETRSQDPRDMAAPQVPMFTISNKDSMIVTFNVSETALLSMDIGDVIKIERNNKEYTARITETASAADLRSGLFAVKASIQNPSETFLTGSAVKVFAETQKARNSIVIPIDAIYHEGGAPYVYVADNGFAKKVFIETGISNDLDIQVISGLQRNDLVIVTWNSNLRDGSELIIID
ncbi:MAG: efflux RND transporter periplasmic adaptor subunit [Oscillospiraceae bacterium]|nr:efflux RND transporter periplasmic adaptor subunit [Oscillospiraceae bacterium]